MDLYEYQARDLFDRHGVPVPPGALATTPEQARRVAGENDMHGKMPFMEPAGGLESVAAVVARPGQNEYCTAIVTAQARRQLGGGPSGALH